MTVPSELIHGRGQQRDTLLLLFYFFRDADDHRRSDKSPVTSDKLKRMK